MKLVSIRNLSVRAKFILLQFDGIMGKQNEELLIHPEEGSLCQDGAVGFCL